jgi:hypothetical protein
MVREQPDEVLPHHAGGPQHADGNAIRHDLLLLIFA